MSRLFYDHLVSLEKTAEKLNAIVSPVEKEELWALVDNLVNHRVMDLILGKLAKSDHDEFLAKFTSEPHSLSVLEYLEQKIGTDISEIISNDLALFEEELMTLIKLV